MKPTATEVATAKATVDEIRERFDQDVERFSNLETGQSAQPDAPLVLDLVARAASAATPNAKSALDAGCGAGNYALKLLERFPALDVTLLDLSRPMLDRAVSRVSAVGKGAVSPMQADIREADLGEERFDLVVSGAALHHLRGEEEWRSVYGKVYRALKPGGSFWIADLVMQEIPAIQALFMERWGEYLTELRDEAYRDAVFAYVEKEDTPRSLQFQLNLMREVGFKATDVLHKSALGAAFGAAK